DTHDFRRISLCIWTVTDAGRRRSASCKHRLHPGNVRRIISKGLLSFKKGGSRMCDYSLHGIRNRLAEQGEVLIVHQFHTGSKGLTSPEYRKANSQPQGFLSALKRLFAGEPEVCAVCIPDGAKLTLRGISPRQQETYGLSSDEAVTFRQLSLNA